MKNKEKNYSEPHHGKNCLKQNTKAAREKKRHNTSKRTPIFQQLVIQQKIWKPDDNEISSFK